MSAQLAELTDLVNDVVSLAQGVEVDEAFVAVDLAALAEQAVARARRHARGLRFELDTRPSVVDGQPGRLERALANLLDNAAAWSPPDGVIEVRAGGGRVEVRDHGPGFAPDDLPRVFDRFYRAASRARVKEGPMERRPLLTWLVPSPDTHVERLDDSGALIQVKRAIDAAKGWHMP